MDELRPDMSSSLKRKPRLEGGEDVIKILKQMLKNKYNFTDNYLFEIATEKTIFSFDRGFEKLFRKK